MKFLPILKKVGVQASKVELPPKIKYCLVFHVSLLKPYHQDQVDRSIGNSQWVLMVIKIQHDKELEEVLADRVVRHSNQLLIYELLIKWKEQPKSEAS